MPLFFLISGFFTAMLWQKRGLRALVVHRLKRIALPLLLCMVTIIPLQWAAIIGSVMTQQYLGYRFDVPIGYEDTLWGKIVADDLNGVRKHIEGGGSVTDINEVDGSIPLNTAGTFGRTEIAELLIEAGADVNQADRNGYYPLHSAAFWGSPDIVRLLLDNGANIDQVDSSGITAIEATEVSQEITQSIITQYQLPFLWAEIEAGREEARAILLEYTSTEENTSSTADNEQPTDASSLPPIDEADLWEPLVEGDTGFVSRYLQAGGDPNAVQEADGNTALGLACLFGHTEIARMLIEAGATVNQADRSGIFPINHASFWGHPDTVTLLLDNGANVNQSDPTGMTLLEALALDWSITEYFINQFSLPFTREEIEAGRAEVIEILEARGEEQFDQSAGLRVMFDAILVQFPFFHHLWFLWFLCWLVAGFAIVFWLIDRTRLSLPLKPWVISPARYIWLLPLTALPYLYMTQPTFGVDTSVGLLPMPHVLLFYAIFFGFGALYFCADDNRAALGRGFWITIPLSLLVIFPVGYELERGAFGFRSFIPEDMRAPLELGTEVSYAWLMTFGCMGIFRRFCSGESAWMRYISDSSYWLYIIHLPLVLVLQLAVAYIPVPAFIKFVVLNVVLIAFLLFTYEYMVRYTFIGRLLNGLRTRPEHASG